MKKGIDTIILCVIIKNRNDEEDSSPFGTVREGYRSEC